MRVMNFITATTFTLITALTPLVVVTVTEQVPPLHARNQNSAVDNSGGRDCFIRRGYRKGLSSAYSGGWSP